VGKLAVKAALTKPRRAGVELRTMRGRRVGWILPPARMSEVSLEWNGRIRGRDVPDGRYSVRLVGGTRALVVRPLRIDSVPPELRNLRVGNGNRPFAGDGPLLATVSPNGDGLRDRAIIRFRLGEPGLVTLEVTRTRTRPTTIFKYTKWFRAGARAMYWRPPPNLNTRTYLTRVTTQDAAGNRETYGAETAWVGRYQRAPVVRVQGIDAGSTEVSYAPGQLATIRISTDAPSLTYQVYQSGPEREVVYADNQMAGVPVADTPPVTVDWSRWTNRPHTISFRVGKWPSGLYYVSFVAPDGRIGYAPFVVRPQTFGAASRIAVVLPTNTWQAYNFRDADGDGVGDTWYADSRRVTSVDLSRAFLDRGVPPHFHGYDLGFLRWLCRTGKEVDFLSEDDLDRVRSGDRLARAYDLIVFPGHTEYVTPREYDVVERFRNLGGNLAFLSANNFFYRVLRRGDAIVKAGKWRELGRSEAALIGVQYLGWNEGRFRNRPYVVRGVHRARWLFRGTGLRNGSRFGTYGIEIDARAPASPRGTTLLAALPNIFGPGRSGEMTYYRTRRGAKVFAAGAMNFGGSALWPLTSRLLENLWRQLSQP
jgi:hypothetical protein